MAEDFLPKKAAGYEDSRSACLGVIVGEEREEDLVGDAEVRGEVDFV
jgi:hypothetical protein